MKGNRIVTFIGIGIALIAAFIGVNRFFLVERLSPEPDNLGVTDDKLRPCPRTPDCVSSQAEPDDRWHYIEAFPLETSVSNAHDILVKILNDMDRVEVETNTPTYIHATSRSLTMGFIDDNEFYIDEANSIVHVRAGARLGLGDGGANRRRVERIRTQYLQAIQ